MEIYISNSGTKPIYEQITDQIKAAILAGKLAEGEALPSIRFLAKELGISVITTKRAYEDLEAAGFIHTVPGKGSFVAAADPELHREATLKKVEELLSQALDVAAAGGVTRSEVLETLKLLSEGE
ncbi:MAG: GntR family transcriptional regulator [Oscillospiraceae bacterium]|uniref:GntR family transcriptional regulator n=1 Tax=Candidatus Allofournierella excrementavium TaxID=2838591 RepID=UPI0015B2B8D4|nr:GntR family transcriptional regulator [Oscillospiraceae bacterium]